MRRGKLLKLAPIPRQASRLLCKVFQRHEGLLQRACIKEVTQGKRGNPREFTYSLVLIPEKSLPWVNSLTYVG